MLLNKAFVGSLKGKFRLFIMCFHDIVFICGDVGIVYLNIQMPSLCFMGFTVGLFSRPFVFWAMKGKDLGLGFIYL